MKIDHFRGEYAFLSNFWEAPVTYQGLTYGSNEAAFQAQKCMTEGEKMEFTQNEDLKWRLIGTGDAYLEEGNTWHDTCWGVDAKTGTGQNHLGKILMKVREELKKM